VFVFYYVNKVNLIIMILSLVFMFFFVCVISTVK